MVKDLYKEEYYENYSIPEYSLHSIAQNNILISPVRLTQRMIKLVDNTDPVTKNLIAKKWISIKKKIDLNLGCDPVIEYNDTIKLGSDIELKY